MVIPTIGNGGNGISVSNSSIYINLNHPLDPNTTYTWQITGQSSSGASASFSGKTATIYLSPGKYLNCTCTVTRPCGSTSASFSCYNYAWGGFSMATSPNPATDELNVEVLDSANTAEALSEAYQVRLYNPQNVLLRQVSTQQRHSKLNVSAIEEGIYYLEIIYKEAVMRRRVVIRR